MLSLVGVLTMVGCSGDAGARETAHEDWENESGQAWKLYVAGYREGWVRGCKAGVKWVLDADPSAGSTWRCGDAPDEPTSEVPQTPPEDPETAGVEDGITDACETAFENMGMDDSRPCSLPAVLLNAEERLVFPMSRP